MYRRPFPLLAMALVATGLWAHTVLPALTAVKTDVTPDAPPCAELITNGSFETGEFADWQTVGSPWLAEEAHAGLLSGALAGSDNASDTFYQEVVLPSAVATTTLAFWWYMETTESGIGTPTDLLYVEARNTTGALLNTLATQSNVSPAGTWTFTAIDLTDYPDLLGLTIRIVFRAATDSSMPTTFFIDEVSLQVCESQPPCPLDIHEPNDNFDEAAALATGISNNSLYICPQDDEDWFRFHANAGDDLDISLYNLPADFDLQLYDSAAQYIVESAAGGQANERIQLVAPVSGDFRLRVFGYNGTWSPEEYTLRIDVTTPATPAPTHTPTHTPTYTPTHTPTHKPTPTPTATSTPTRTLTTTPTSTPTSTTPPIPTASTTTAACPSDPTEPNNTADQAKHIALSTFVYICPKTDEDWFQFTATKAQEFEIELYNLPANFDLELYDVTRKRIAASNNGSSQNENIQFTAAASGAYRIRVYSASRAFSRYSAVLNIRQLTQQRPLLLSAKKYTQPFDIVVDGTTAYWTELSGEQDSPPGGIYMNNYASDPATPKTVYTTANFSPADLALENSKLYYREWQHDWIGQVSATPGAAPAEVIAVGMGLAYSRGIEADMTHVYWGDQASLHRQKLADRSLETLIYFGTDYSQTNALTANSSYIYWTDTTSTVDGAVGRIHRTAKIGGNPINTGVGTQGATFKYIDVVNHVGAGDQDVYAASDHSIEVWPDTGARPPQAVYTTQPGASITGLAVGVDNIYWTEDDAFANALLYMPRKGGNPRVIVTGLSNPRALTAAGGSLFWSESTGIMFIEKPDLLSGAAPYVSVTHSPSSPAPADTIVLKAIADDDDGIRELQVYIDGSMVKTCKANVCSHSYAAPRHATVVKYMAIATDSQGFRSRTPIKLLLIGNDGQDYDRDGLSDAMESVLCTDRLNPDSDHDEILDGWEVLGQSFSDGSLLDLPGMGAHPCRTDVFVEVDWHKGYSPDPSQIQRTVNQFRQHGIALHVDTGQYGGGSEVPLVTGSANPFNDTTNAAQARDPFSDSHRLSTFHYVLSAGHCPRDAQGRENCRGGIDKGSNATLRKTRGTWFGLTLIHELGHSIGMGHGGTTGPRGQLRIGDHVLYDYDWITTNRKANYLSIMNYAQSPLIYWNGSSLVRDLGFSSMALPDLNEAALDESPNSAFAQALARYPRLGTSKPLIVYYCKGHSPPYRVLSDGNTVIRRYNYDTRKWEPGPARGPSGIDWNCNGNIESSVRVDINDDGRYTTLLGRSDWPSLPLRSLCPGRRDAYSAGYLQSADLPPCVTSTLTTPSRPSEARLTRIDEADPEPLPSDDPLWELPHELCDGRDNDGDGVIDNGCPDRDGDTVPDGMDNCPFTPNPDQSDVDLNWIGDACEAAPGSPAPLSAENVNGGVMLRWTASPELTVKGYIVLRAPAVGTPLFKHLGGYPSVNHETTTFFDRTLPAPGRYLYRVRALNRYDREGEAAATELSVVDVFGLINYLPATLHGR